ncbi:MAG: cell wall hydrolase [Pseudobdellovibrionaceae bacterium]
MTKPPQLTPVPSAGTPAARDFEAQREVDILARTLWGEARGEGIQGMEAVACVILNRLAIAKAHGFDYWWGNSVIQICQKSYQFSCWNKDDPNYPRLLAVDAASNMQFATALRIARRALLGFLTDATGGATHYHARHVSPNWIAGSAPVAAIGHHVFYKLVE